MLIVTRSEGALVSRIAFDPFRLLQNQNYEHLAQLIFRVLSDASDIFVSYEDLVESYTKASLDVLLWSF